MQAREVVAFAIGGVLVLVGLVFLIRRHESDEHEIGIGELRLRTRNIGIILVALGSVVALVPLWLHERKPEPEPVPWVPEIHSENTIDFDESLRTFNSLMQGGQQQLMNPVNGCLAVLETYCARCEPDSATCLTDAVLRCALSQPVPDSEVAGCLERAENAACAELAAELQSDRGIQCR